MAERAAGNGIMTACFICSNPAFREVPMSAPDVLVPFARDLIQGLVQGAREGKTLRGSLPRRGTTIVERCARTVEEACGRCRASDCLRCTIAAELRSSEDRIVAARDAELIDLSDDTEVEAVVDQLAKTLCESHVAFSSVLIEEWYQRRSRRADTL